MAAWSEEFKADDVVIYEVTYMQVFSNEVEHILERRST